MNAYYTRNSGKKSNTFVKKSSIKGTAFARPKKSRSLADTLDLILSLIDSIVAFFANAKVRVAGKAVAGFACVIGVIGVIGRIELGTISLISGVTALSLIILIEFLVVREK